MPELYEPPEAQILEEDAVLFHSSPKRGGGSLARRLRQSCSSLVSDGKRLSHRLLDRCVVTSRPAAAAISSTFPRRASTSSIGSCLCSGEHEISLDSFQKVASLEDVGTSLDAATFHDRGNPSVWVRTDNNRDLFADGIHRGTAATSLDGENNAASPLLPRFPLFSPFSSRGKREEEEEEEEEESSGFGSFSDSSQANTSTLPREEVEIAIRDDILC